MRERELTAFKKTSALLIAVLLIFSCCTFSASAVESRASYYLDSYTSYICAMGNGEIQIWFYVTGVDDWADIGALTIQLYESSTNTTSSTWTWVETFQHYDNKQMLAHDTWHILECVSYQGTPGKYYKAYVTIWAGDEDNNGDTRYIWTPVELCT